MTSTGVDLVKPYKGMPMEGIIATWYARNTARDLRRFTRLAERVRATLAPGSRILEVAPGPGYLAIEIARSGAYSVTGLDISRSFVAIARANARKARVLVDFHYGSADQMPYANAAFDFVICVAAFKNFSDPIGALDEIHRVLKPGAHALIHDLRKDASPAEIRREVQDMQLPAVDEAITRFIFRYVLLKKAYSRGALAGLLAESRFAGEGEIRADGVGFELRLRKP